MAKKNTKVILTSGKRKTAIARVKLVEDKKNPLIRINGLTLEAMENDYNKLKIMEPLTLIGDIYKNNLNITVKVEGGGSVSQAEAIRSGIARALLKYYKNNNQVEAIYNDYDKTMISGDVRRREMKKAGGRGARARFQKSYR